MVETYPFINYFDPETLREIRFGHHCIDAGFSLTTTMMRDVKISWLTEESLSEDIAQALSALGSTTRGRSTPISPATTGSIVTASSIAAGPSAFTTATALHGHNSMDQDGPSAPATGYQTVNEDEA